MALDEATVRRVARLARIKVPEGRLAPLAEQLDNIIRWVEQLNEVETDGVQPMSSVVAMRLRMRDDEVTDGGDPARVLANAPETARDYYTVPKVVE